MSLSSKPEVPRMLSSRRVRAGCCVTALVAVALGTGLAAARGLPGPSSACPWVSTWWDVVPQFTITRTGVWNAGRKPGVPTISVMATEIDTALPVPKQTLISSPAGAEITEPALRPASS